MNYDLRFDICRKLRELEYARYDPEGLRKEIISSHEFSREEIDYLNKEIDRIVKVPNRSGGFESLLQKYFPYILTFVAGYGTHMLQEKAGELIREGEEKARNEVLSKFSS
jgi:hypothetical protein